MRFSFRLGFEQGHHFDGAHEIPEFLPFINSTAPAVALD
jgi:hypothetical protein